MKTRGQHFMADLHERKKHQALTKLGNPKTNINSKS